MALSQTIRVSTDRQIVYLRVEMPEREVLRMDAIIVALQSLLMTNPSETLREIRSARANEDLFELSYHGSKVLISIRVIGCIFHSG